MHRRLPSALTLAAAALLACAGLALASRDVQAQAPTLQFSPNGGVIIPGTDISVSAVGGAAGANASYACTAPNGVTVTNAAGTLSTGNALRTLAVSCPANTPDGPMTCTRTGGDPTPLTFSVDCPSIGVSLSASPPGGLLSCDGPAGSTQYQSITFSSIFALVSGLGCSVAGAGFSLAQAPASMLPAGSSTTAIVACEVSASGQPARSGTLLCSSVGGGQFAYTLSSSATSGATFTRPALVPHAGARTLAALAMLFVLLGAAALRSARR